MRQLEELNFSDDFIFWKVMSKPDLCRQVLEVILNRQIRKVSFSSSSQQTIENAYDGHGVRLDVIAEDEHSTHYNIEMQMNKKYNLRKCSRYYRGQIDLDLLRKGMDYEELPETIVIFICLFDEFGRGRSIYTFREICEEDTTLELQDETRIIFLNSRGDVSHAAPELQAFMAYLNDPQTAGKTDVKLISSLQQEVNAVKKASEAREEYMKLELLMKEQRQEGYEKGKAEGREEGRTEGREQGKADLCIQMHKKGLSVEDIAKYTGLDIKKVQEMIHTAN